MDALVLLLFQLIVWIFKLTGRLLWWLLQVLRSVPGRVERRWSGSAGGMEAMRERPSAGSMQPKPTSQARDRRREGVDLAALDQRLEDLTRRITGEAARCAAHTATQPLAEALERHVLATVTGARQRLLRKKQDVAAEVRNTMMGQERLLELMARMAAQRRDPMLLPVLESADGLARGIWEAVRQYAAGAGVVFGPERCVAVFGAGEVWAGDARALGVAPLYLPLDWATEPVKGPALVHEFGHRLYGGFAGLEVELLEVLGLSRAALVADRSGVKPLLAAWLEELWVDTVGVMMLGAAYVRSMMWVFGSEETPERVVEYRLPGAVPLMDRRGGGARYDEHPPAHLRVLLACHTLAQLGEASEAAACEGEWRDRHDSPEEFYILTSNSGGLSVEEAFFREPGRVLVTALRERSWASLGMAGRALRNLPGLERGPHERRAVEEAMARLIQGRSVATREARVLIAGMVRAHLQEPRAVPRILETARATVRMWGGKEQGEDEGMVVEEAGDSVEDALLLAAILPPPRSLRRRWSSGA